MMTRSEARHLRSKERCLWNKAGHLRSTVRHLRSKARHLQNETLKQSETLEEMGAEQPKTLVL